MGNTIPKPPIQTNQAFIVIGFILSPCSVAFFIFC
ncbi:hypothetical protein M948_17200 [Virgibacillus sp. CM-4]|nr:hypothetical protein M948_17200 [Virgibacillus sp. CM-4]